MNLQSLHSTDQDSNNLGLEISDIIHLYSTFSINSVIKCLRIYSAKNFLH